MSLGRCCLGCVDGWVFWWFYCGWAYFRAYWKM